MDKAQCDKCDYQHSKYDIDHGMGDGFCYMWEHEPEGCKQYKPTKTDPCTCMFGMCVTHG